MQGAKNGRPDRGRQVRSFEKVGLEVDLDQLSIGLEAIIDIGQAQLLGCDAI